VAEAVVIGEAEDLVEAEAAIVAGGLADLGEDRAVVAGLPAVGEMFFSDFAEMMLRRSGFRVWTYKILS
jgi:hypothetical protein